MTSAAAAAFAVPAPTAPTAPAADPGAAAPSGSAAPAPMPAGDPPSTPAANSNWYDGFENADVKTWTAAKGFKDPSAVAESAYNLEKLIGFDKAGRTLVVPKDDASPEEVQAFQRKLGVPDKASDYKLALPEGSDPKLNETIQGWMHKAGATPKVAASLTEQFVAFSAQEKTAQEGKLIEGSDKAFAAVTSRWGKDADANLELGKRFTANLLPPEVTLDDGTKVNRQQFLERVFNSTGATGAMLELFASAGRGMGEHRMRTNGDSGMGDASPGAAQAKIMQLRADTAWVKSYLSGDKAKIDEMQRLTQQASPISQ